MINRTRLFVLFAVLLFASPALAAPAMFTAGVSLNKMFYFTSVVGVPQPSPPGTASVTGLGPASFTLPPGTLGAPSSGCTTGGYYPYLGWSLYRYNAGPGGFSPAFLPPSTGIFIPADTTMYPNYPTPRAGYMFLAVGPNGFGGAMPFVTVGSYTGLWPGLAVPSYYLYMSMMAPRGATPLTVPGAVTGSRVHSFLKSTANGPLVISSTGVATQAPWFTGTAVAYGPAGFYPTLVTAMGTDARTPLGMSGTISLVTPRLLHRYLKIGTILVFKNGDFASVATLTASFAPEPGRLALLATGLLGLFTLRRLRR